MEGRRRVVVSRPLRADRVRESQLGRVKDIGVILHEGEDGPRVLLFPGGEQLLANPVCVVGRGALVDVAEEVLKRDTKLRREKTTIDFSGQLQRLLVVTALVILARRQQAREMFLGLFAVQVDSIL